MLISSEKKEAKVFPFPHTDNEFVAEQLLSLESNISVFPFLVVNENEKLIHIKWMPLPAWVAIIIAGHMVKVFLQFQSQATN